MRIHNREELSKIREMAADKVSSTKCRILICAGTGCLAGGSGEIYEKMCELTKDCKDVDVEFGPEIAHGSEHPVDVYKRQAGRYPDYRSCDRMSHQCGRSV